VLEFFKLFESPNSFLSLASIKHVFLFSVTFYLCLCCVLLSASLLCAGSSNTCASLLFRLSSAVFAKLFDTLSLPAVLIYLAFVSGGPRGEQKGFTGKPGSWGYLFPLGEKRKNQKKKVFVFNSKEQLGLGDGDDDDACVRSGYGSPFFLRWLSAMKQ
jgi:hypothetical protein